MAKRRLPKGTDIRWAIHFKANFQTKKSAKEIQHRWISKEKRRTHKRERREGKKACDE